MTPFHTTLEPGKVNVWLYRITELQGCFKSLVGLRLLLIVYLMHQVFEKKSLENWNIIKNGHSEDYTSDTSKPGNFNGLGGNLKLPPKLLKFPALLVLKRRVSAKIQCCSYFSHPLDDRHGTSPEALGPAGIVVKTRAKNCSKVL